MDGDLPGHPARLIPACAGRAGSRGRGCRSIRAHPRMRGEGSTRPAPAAAAIGSSPHARGGRPGQEGHGQDPRLIPACAGRATIRTRTRRYLPTHPRMRGEGPMRIRDVMVELGSSPHARGGRQVRFFVADEVRLIPACAGRAWSCLSLVVSGAAHPRMRGEGGVDRAAGPQPRGSSPHARGGQVEGVGGPGGVRLIPACAGRAGFPPLWPLRRGAHPRMRGEGPQRFGEVDYLTGSSPHARGGRRGRGAGARRAGLIPACAGRALGSLESASP